MARTVDNLFRAGANVYYHAIKRAHVSGHASQEELKLMLNLTRPRYIIPIHGEFRMLVQHGRLAQEVGLQPENILILENGQPIEFLADGSARRGEKVEAGRVYVHYGTYGTACLDTQDGRTLWARRDLNCDHHEGPGASPILFKDLLAEYRGKGRTVIFSTHIMEQAEKLCEYICMISAGDKVLDGKIALRVLTDASGRVAEAWSYADLDRAIRGTAAGLRAAGLSRGDRARQRAPRGLPRMFR